MKNKLISLLKWSEKYTKTDMNYLVSGSFWLSLGQFISAIAAIGLAVLFANILTSEQYGTYQFIISMGGIVAVFSLSGMRFSIIRGVAQIGNIAFVTGFKTYMKWSVGMALVSFAIALYYYINNNIELSIAMLFVGALSPFFRGFGLYQTLLTGQKRHDAYSVIRIIYTLVTTTSLAVAIFLTTSPILIAFIYFLSHTVVLGFILLYVWKKYGGIESDSPKEETHAKQVASYGKQLSLLHVGNKLAAELDKVLTFHFLGPASLAVYTLAYSPVKELIHGGEILRTLLLPKLSESNIAVIKKTLLRKAFLFFLFLIPIVIAYFFAAPYLYATLFPKYLDSIIYSQILVFTLLFLPIIVFRQTFIAHKQTKALYVIDTVLPVFKILLLLIFLPIFGIYGAILAIYLHLILSLIILLYLFARM